MDKLRTQKTWWLLCILSSTLFVNCDEWLDPLNSKFQLVNELEKTTVDLTAFAGNNSFTNNFKLLEEGASSIIVGGRNVIYNLSLPHLQEVKQEVG